MSASLPLRNMMSFSPIALILCLQQHHPQLLAFLGCHWYRTLDIVIQASEATSSANTRHSRRRCYTKCILQRILLHLNNAEVGDFDIVGAAGAVTPASDPLQQTQLTMLSIKPLQGSDFTPEYLYVLVIYRL